MKRIPSALRTSLATILLLALVGGLFVSSARAETKQQRDARMQWWRQARFGMFVHYGLYALYGRNEWVMALENIPVAEYEKKANDFKPRPGCPRPSRASPSRPSGRCT